MFSSALHALARPAHSRGHCERGKMMMMTTTTASPLSTTMAFASAPRLRRCRHPPPLFFAARRLLPLSPPPLPLPPPSATPPSAPAATSKGEEAAASFSASAADVDHVQLALADLEDESLVVVAQTAPAVRVAIGEEVGLAPGAVKPGQLVSALREIGFDYVFDVAMGADLTIMEEGYELLARLTERAAAAASEGVGSAPASASASAEQQQQHHHLHGPLPMFTSCCPGWVSFVEVAAPELLPHVSTCKSPHLMLGAVLKAFFGPKILGIDPGKMRVVSVMPCLKKQGEADREGNEWEGRRDVDHVITTRDLGKIIRERGIDLASLPVGVYDDPLTPRPGGGGGGGSGTSSPSSQSGSGVLFGTTGGVMEAALRTVYEAVTGQRLERLVFEECRGLEGVKEATVHMTVPEGSPLLVGTGATELAAETEEEKRQQASPPAAVSSSSRVFLPDSSSSSPSDSSPSSSSSSSSSSSPPYPPQPRAGPVPLTGMDSTLHLRVAVCNGLGNAKKLLAKIKEGSAPPYDAVEVMACPGGCVGGGGQPRSADKGAVAARQAALYSLDERAAVRRSHENPAVRALYERFLGEPLSPDAEAHLHVPPPGQRERTKAEGEEKENQGVAVVVAPCPSGSHVDALAAATRARGARRESEKEKGGGDDAAEDHHECDWCGALVAEGGRAPAVVEK